MQRNKLPADMAEIAGPLQEAAAYETSNWRRRRGLYNFVTGLVMLLVAVVLIFARTGTLPTPLFVGAITLVVLALTSFMALRRFSPAWEPVFVDPRRRGVPMRQDRLRWMVFGLALVYMATRILQDEGVLSGGTAVAALGVILLAIVAGLGTKYRGDGPLALAYGMLAIFAIPIGLGVVPSELAIPLLFACMAVVSFLVGTIRIATARRTTQ